MCQFLGWLRIEFQTPLDRSECDSAYSTQFFVYTCRIPDWILSKTKKEKRERKWWDSGEEIEDWSW